MHSYLTNHLSFHRLPVASAGNRRTAMLEVPNFQLRRRVIANTRRSCVFAQPPTERPATGRNERHFLSRLMAGVSVTNT
jgi:hypothetical protein